MQLTEKQTKALGTLNLIWKGVSYPLPHCWFSLNNSETVKAVTLAFCRNQQHFIRDVCTKFGIPNLSQSPDIGQNSDRSISNFRISGQSFIKGNCHDSRISDDIDMKLGSGQEKQNNVKKNLAMVLCRKILTSLPFFNLQPIWSNPEAEFRTHSL